MELTKEVFENIFEIAFRAGMEWNEDCWKQERDDAEKAHRAFFVLAKTFGIKPDFDLIDDLTDNVVTDAIEKAQEEDELERQYFADMKAIPFWRALGYRNF